MAMPADLGSKRIKHTSGCLCCTTRRTILAASAAFAVRGFETGAKAQEPSTSSNQARIIDVHYHILPPKYVTVARDRLLSFAPNFVSVLEWTPARSLEQMDKFGVTLAMTSLSNPGTWFGDAKEARDLARMSNEYAAQTVRDYPGRFGSGLRLRRFHHLASLGIAFFWRLKYRFHQTTYSGNNRRRLSGATAQIRPTQANVCFPLRHARTPISPSSFSAVEPKRVYTTER